MATRLLLVGCGNMGHAMLVGWLKAGRVAAPEVAVVEPNDSLRERAAGLGVEAAAEPGALSAEASPELIVLAVKPQVIREVARAYAPMTARGAAVLSIAAGTRMAVFEEIFGKEAAVLRCMPNTPAAIGKGLMALVANPNVEAYQQDFVQSLLSANGMVVAVDSEDQMDAVTAVSGSGPAYIFHFIECLREAGIAAGLPREAAAALAMQTVYGAASLAAESGEEPGRLREQVTSPNGTTAAALAVLMGEGRLEALVTEAVLAARKRSIELA